MRKLALILSVLTVASAADTAYALPPLQTVQVGSGFNSPTFATGAPGDPDHLYILEKGASGSASIKSLNLTTHVATNFLTITGVATDSEEGLLGLAFDPNYTTNGTFYIDYVATGGTAGRTTIAEYKTQPAGSPTFVGNLLQFDQPETNHKGGWISFSPRPGDDHNLYIATGDGGNGYDQGSGHIEPGGNAQNTQTFLGKMLRVHVDPATATYTIPANNPFASASNPAVKKEIFAYGLRNPFRDSFDPATGTLYLGDVGQDTREELDVQTSPGGGENYGWRLREGNIQTPGSVGGSAAGTVAPILDYDHAVGVTTLAGQTIIGGYVYRGALIPALDGTYVFGDYLGNSNEPTEIFSLNYDGATVSNLTDLTALLNPGSPSRIANISSFGEDSSGELYIVDIGSGKIFQIVPEPASVAILALGALALLARRP